MEVNLCCPPFVQDRLRVRLAVHIDEKRILLRCIEVPGLKHPGIKFKKTVADIKFQEFGWMGNDRLHFSTDVAIVLKGRRYAVSFDFDQLMQRRGIEGRVGMDRILGVRRKKVAVCADLVSRRDSAALSGTIQRDSIQVLLRRISRRGVVVIPAALFIDNTAINDVMFLVGQPCHFIPVARIAVSVTPTILFADDHKSLASLNPDEARVFPLT